MDLPDPLSMIQYQQPFPARRNIKVTQLQWNLYQFGHCSGFRIQFGRTISGTGSTIVQQQDNTSADIYLDREDGSSELFVENLKWENTEVFQKMWYLAQDGSIYCVEKEYGKETEYIAKRDGQGALLYEKQLELQVPSFWPNISSLSD